MATGYTQELYEGEQSVREFILTCARAFGATIGQRDEPLSVTPRLPEPPDVDGAKATIQQRVALLATAEGMTDEEADALAEAKYTEEYAYWAEREHKKATLRARYDNMLSHINEWTPPSAGHEGLKKFMIEQLEESLKWDCNPTDPPTRQTGEEYRQTQIEYQTHMIEYYSETLERDIERFQQRSQWLTDLFDSLPTEAVNA